MTNTVDVDKRRFLTNATTVVGGIGAIAVAIPFISSLSPSARAEAAGAPVTLDISKLEVGQMITIEWRGKPVWVLRRTDETLS
ncbi:MAG: ubiquinol-cytochrome c reductase iron-sulfur subunit, partial [Piscirickettsiaceae bacterium]|nr:ubiquinol-cytochrome c reductase iron-sulfur subunit [Piscirickettsiaceae bacterium]